MNYDLSTIYPLTLYSVIFRTFLSVLLSGIVGFERGLKNRPAGLRTYMLVSLGACMIMMVNQYVTQAYGVGDPARLGAQVVSGIGFLGAGTIIVTKHNGIKGLTTAAGLWASACIGLAVGIGLYEVAVSGALMVFFILAVMQKVDVILTKKAKAVVVLIELKENVSLAGTLKAIGAQGLTFHGIEPEYRSENGHVSFVAALQGQHGMAPQELLQALRAIDSIFYVEILSI